ncbi:leucine-rich repeat-containing protein 15 [Galendromus occidentalis]|uniref:Leucine-rich repeat-containing protein 15 n=1 Tax=Galendromus occidentalis TaxID=34638 RepID=A0AAJ7WHV9_9ACAR|nr:leucine-rich repeat-containing protein 15 [Galendromus occidentalis]
MASDSYYEKLIVRYVKAAACLALLGATEAEVNLEPGLAIRQQNDKPPIVKMLPFVFLLLFGATSGWRGFCPLRCRCNDKELVVHCNDAALDVIPITLNPGLRELHLARNTIKNIMSAFSVYPTLESLDVSHNQLHNLNKNNFHLRHLMQLDISNNFVEEVNAETFRGLQNLNELNLRKNSLSSLPARAFHDMRNLELLDLSNNQLVKIDQSAFIGLVRLQKLILRSNSFEEIPSEAFAHLSHLHTLDYGGNAISRVPNHAFHYLSRLRELYLDRCNIAVFELKAFNGLVSLVNLNLQYNSLERFPAQALAELHKLEELSVGGNRFGEIQSGDLHVLPGLKKFSLTQSESFERIAEDAFDHSPNVEQVLLENNKLLQHLPEKLFAQLRVLKHVSLRGNALRFIHPKAVPVGQLDTFDISKNPLICNCSIEWLWNQLRFHESIAYHNSSGARCAGPANLQHELIKNLSQADLDCDGPAKRGLLVLGVTAACVLGILIAGAVALWWRRRSLALIKTKQMQLGCDSNTLTAPMVEHHNHQTYLTQAHFGPGTLPLPLPPQSPYHGSSYYSSQHTLNSTGYLISNPMDSANHVYMTVGPPSPQHKIPHSPALNQCYYTMSTEKKYKPNQASLAYI